MIRRFSSRREPLGRVFLAERLKGARSYKRIAGYFRSSLLELCYEEIAAVPIVRVVCNSDLDPRDVAAARAAHDRDVALKERWNDGASVTASVFDRDRYQRLHALLVGGNLEVRVVPRTVAPFLHGKAGVIERADGSKTSFIGSNNETREGWANHYELAWEDDSAENSPAIDEAYASALEFTKLLGQRQRSVGFLQSLLLQRICSSLASGLSTARKLLARGVLDDDENLDGPTPVPSADSSLLPAERAALQRVVAALEGQESDPKLSAVLFFLLDGRQWLEHGCIVFSQFYDTTAWVARELSQRMADEVVGVYAGAGKSGLYRGGRFTTADRDSIKASVKKGELRLVVATDAACEGLNLQALGTLINVDLPWNPSRLKAADVTEAKVSAIDAKIAAVSAADAAQAGKLGVARSAGSTRNALATELRALVARIKVAAERAAAEPGQSAILDELTGALSDAV